MAPVLRVSRVTSLAAAALLGLSLLAGCGGEAGPRPGLGIEVGDQRISAADVDRVTSDYCAALEQVAADSIGVLPLGDLRRTVVQALTQRAAVDAFLDEHDGDVDEQRLADAYADAVAQVRAETAHLDPDVADSVERVVGSKAYVQALGQALGRSASADFDAWAKEQQPVLNPAYGLRFDDGRLVQDSGLSVPAGDARTDPHALPDNQRCGTAG